MLPHGHGSVSSSSRSSLAAAPESARAGSVARTDPARDGVSEATLDRALAILRAVRDGFRRRDVHLAAPEREALTRIIEVARTILSGVRGPDPPLSPAGRHGTMTLTARECQVLELVSQGMSRAGVALALQLSKHTVNMHVSNAASKLEVVGGHAAAAKARALGLIS